VNDIDEHLMTVFTAALDHGTTEERAVYLDRACAGFPGLRDRVEALLRAHNRGGNFLGGMPPDQTVTFVLAPEPGVRSSSRAYGEEIRQLLRSRLILVHLLALLYVALLKALTLSTPGGNTLAQPDQGNPWTFFPVFAQCSLGAAVLWRMPGMSLRSLRLWEVAHFVTVVVFYSWLRFVMLAYTAWTAPDPFMTVGFFGAVNLFNTTAIILSYGVLIPNTRRRSLVGVAAITLSPFLAVVAAAAANPAMRDGHVVPLFAQAAANLAFPAAIAIFAANRAAALQRRAFEAERRANQIGQYTLRRKLGEGGMGEVWLAEHGLLKRPCAVKFVRPELAQNPATAARFAREVQAVTRLSHVNTVRIYDYGRADDGSFYLVMEYLDGPTLEALVHELGALPPGRAVYLLRQVCGALAEAHAADLVHRDLKPSNVIVASLGGQHDVAKLLDFGLVQDLSADADAGLTRTGTVLGTPAYMSPEQAMGETVDARGDVYSLGAVAFFVLTGRPLFQGKTLGQLLAAHHAEPPPSLTDLRPEVPADLGTVIARCLAKKPGERFQSVVDLERALGRCFCATDWSAERAAGWWAEHARVDLRRQVESEVGYGGNSQQVP
jgi:tRNA A-37 threonylcarbamoyl transferase component Bud32